MVPTDLTRNEINLFDNPDKFITSPIIGQNLQSYGGRPTYTSDLNPIFESNSKDEQSV
jgi:hypothetical protein